jgi:hypothetical protein
MAAYQNTNLQYDLYIGSAAGTRAFNVHGELKVEYYVYGDRDEFGKGGPGSTS